MVDVGVSIFMHSTARVRVIFFSVSRNKDEIVEERLNQARVFILGGPREKFTAAEVRPRE